MDGWYRFLWPPSLFDGFGQIRLSKATECLTTFTKVSTDAHVKPKPLKTPQEVLKPMSPKPLTLALRFGV